VARESISRDEIIVTYFEGIMEESENRDLQEQELEGLKMTLTDQELKVLTED
jgi:hypothetical protein